MESELSASDHTMTKFLYCALTSYKLYCPITFCFPTLIPAGIFFYSLTAMWVKKLESNREWFLEQENLKSDESKRPGKSIDSGELFGFQGSFRRLSLD
jgi:hypothetical protein